MDSGEQSTGTRDEYYDLISVLYYALHGAENCEIYVADAAAVGREDLATFFREAQAAQSRLAERAKMMQGILEVPPEPQIAPDAPPEGGVTPSTAEGSTEIARGYGCTTSPNDAEGHKEGTSAEPPPRSGYKTEPSPRPGEDVPPPGNERPSVSDREPQPPDPHQI